MYMDAAAAIDVAPRLAPGPARRRPWPVAGRTSPLATGRDASTFLRMAAKPPDEALAAEERRLARAAAGGDGAAFATLYQRYEQRAYNLAYRLTGSEADAADAVQDAFVGVLQRLPRLEDREFEFGSYVFTATRNAAYDLIKRSNRTRPSEEIHESATPLGSGAGGLGLDPGDPDEDPDRRQLLRAQRDEVREANSRLPERQREVLALRELEELSYDEIAEIMAMNRNSVAQLISRARLNLRAELRGAALGSIAGDSPECERALPLIARRDDGELGDAGEAAWLESHLSGCHGCRLGSEAMQEAGVSYRAWAPIAAAPWVFDQTMAKAAEALGVDWSDVPRPSSKHPAAIPGMPPMYVEAYGEAQARGAGPRRPLAAAAGLALVALLVALVAASQIDDATRAPEPAAIEGRAVSAPVTEKKLAGEEPGRRTVEKRPPEVSTTPRSNTEDTTLLPVGEESGGSGGGGSSGRSPAPPKQSGDPTPKPESGGQPSVGKGTGKDPAPADEPAPEVVPPPPPAEEPTTTPPPEPPPPSSCPVGTAAVPGGPCK